MKIRDVFTYLLSWMTDFSSYQKLGFKGKTYNNDFILTKTYPRFGVTVEVYQGFGPHHPEYAEFIDFEIPDACVLIIGARRVPELGRELTTHFEFVKERGDYLFAYSRFLEIDDLKIKSAIDFLEAKLG